MTTPPISPELACCVEAARERKAEELLVLDLRGLSDITDYFVICHGTSDRQVSAIADSIEGRLEQELDCRAKGIEGKRAADWILMDYIDFIVHVFLEEKRRFYRLERLWGDAPRLDIVDLAPKRSPASPGRG